MAQHDHDIANASGASVRADMNLLFAAIASNNSGSSEPSTKFANMWWFDTSNNLLKQRNEANNAWITVALKDATNWKNYFGTVQLDAAAMVWTGDHNFGNQVIFSGVVSPSQITSNQNNYNPTSLADALQLRVNTDASRNVTGMAGGAVGRLMQLSNIGSFDLVLISESGSSTAGNRFLFSAGDLTLGPDEAVLLIYDGTDSRWRAADDRTRQSSFILRTPIATTSGTTAGFTGLPARCNAFSCHLDGVSLNGATDELMIQLGDSGGYENSGYIGDASEGSSNQNETTGAIITQDTSAANAFTGQIDFRRVIGNTWTWNGALSRGQSINVCAGEKTLTAELDRVQLTLTGTPTDAFDAGDFSVSTQT